MQMSMAMGLRLLHHFASCIAVAAIAFTALLPLPAMAKPTDHNTIPITLATMSNKADAKAKEVEGKLDARTIDELQPHQALVRKHPGRPRVAVRGLGNGDVDHAGPERGGPG